MKNINLIIISLLALSWTMAVAQIHQSYENFFPTNSWIIRIPENGHQQPVKLQIHPKTTPASDSIKKPNRNILPNKEKALRDKNTRKSHPKFNITSGVEHFIFVRDYRLSFNP